MKNTLLVLLGLALGVGGCWLVSTLRPPAALAAVPPPQGNVLITPKPAAPAAPAFNPGLPTASDWQAFRTARDQTLQANPGLNAEYKAILADMDTQQKALDAAMLKADPKVAPVIAKLEALRQRNAIPRTP